jgi:hypothetical protein
VDNPAADPRIRLAFRTAGEARLGQALKGDRSVLDLSACGAFGLGRFTIPDNGKEGTAIDLTSDMRAAWDYELSEGFLKELEAAYQALRSYGGVGGTARAVSERTWRRTSRATTAR